MSTKMIALNSYSILSILLLSTLISFCSTSRRVIKITSNGVTKINQCSIKALGTFLPTSSLMLQATKGDELTNKICPNLVYSCCDSNMILSMAENLKMAMGYLKDRNVYVKQLMDNATNLSPETYSLFLDSLTDKDEACYDNILNENLEDIRISHGFNQEEMDQMRARKKGLLYDKGVFKSNFDKLRKQIPEYLQNLDDQLRRRGRHYASFVCNMCSPGFIKIFKDDVDPPILKVNKGYCAGLLKETTRDLCWKNVYVWTQQLIDLAYCARNNSKPEKQFKGADWRGNDIMKEDSDVISALMERINECITTPQLFYTNQDSEDSCLNLCKNKVQFPTITMIAINRIMNAENEFHNMFLATLESMAPAERIEYRQKTFHDSQAKILENGILVYSDDKFIQLHMLMPVKNPPIDFSKVQFMVTRLNGMSRRANEMEVEYYNGSSLKNLIVVLLLSALLNSI